MCFFLCGGLSYLFYRPQWKNVKRQRDNWTPQHSNIKLHRKNITPHRKNIKQQRNNWTPHRANITPQRKKIKLHRKNVTLHQKNIKTSRSNIIFGMYIQYSKRLYILVRCLRKGFLHIFWSFGRLNINLFRLHIKFGLFLSIYY